MNKAEAKQLLDSFELYIHDEYGEKLITGMKDNFLKWKYGEVENLPISDVNTRPKFKELNG